MHAIFAAADEPGGGSRLPDKTDSASLVDSRPATHVPTTMRSWHRIGPPFWGTGYVWGSSSFACRSHKLAVAPFVDRIRAVARAPRNLRVRAQFVGARRVARRLPINRSSRHAFRNVRATGSILVTSAGNDLGCASRGVRFLSLHDLVSVHRRERNGASGPLRRRRCRHRPAIANPDVGSDENLL